MPNLRLPDGSQRSFDHPVTVAELPATIPLPALVLAVDAVTTQLSPRLIPTPGEPVVPIAWLSCTSEFART